MVKMFKCAERSRSSMMDVEDEHNHMRAAFGLRDRIGQPELLLQNEYLAAENRILKARLQQSWRLSDGERATLAEIGKRLGRKGLERVARLAKPDTILAWYRQLVAEKFDGCKKRRTPGRPRTDPEIEDLVVRLACENSGWGYDRIVGALAIECLAGAVYKKLMYLGIGPIYAAK